MAKTNKLESYVKTARGLEALPLREAQSKSAALYLLELRSRHTVAQTDLPKRKLVVTIGHEQGNPNLPRVIRIRRA